MTDVVITPASGLIDFQNISGISSATIQLDGNGNLSITAAEGDIEIGNTASDIFVGDGVANVDIIFEEDGEIRGLTGKTITFGQSDSFIAFAGDVTGDVSFTNGLNVTGGNLGIGTDNPNVKLDVVGDANISGVVTATSFVKESNSGGFLKADGTEDTNTYLTSYTETQTLDDVLGLGNTSSTGLSVGVATATSFVKDGGTSSQFLKADGSVDSSTYLTSYTETQALDDVVGLGSDTTQTITVGTATTGIILRPDGTLNVSGASTFSDDLTLSKSGNPSLTVATSNNSGSDALIRIRGARTLSSTSDIAMLQFDNKTSSAYTMAQISAMDPAADHLDGKGKLVFRTSTGGTLSDQVTIMDSGDVGIGTDTPAYKLEVNGSFAATTKSFIIDHPTKNGMKLRYSSLEGPENGVYVRGRLKGNNTIELPEHWTGLVDEETITVNLTPIGRKAILHSVVDIVDNTVIVESVNDIVDCFYTVFGERKDVEKLEVEF